MLNHIAVIMDGNRRWAVARGLLVAEGHRRGAAAARRIIEETAKRKIGFLTLYAFSSENWNRPKTEVNELMGLLRYYLNKELKSLHENNIRVLILGDRSRLEADIDEQIRAAEDLTSNNTGLTLSIALSYGSRQEIVNAVKNAVNKLSEQEIANLDEKTFAKFLYTKNLPDPDLLIRTGGEERLSNFLLWQFAYTELYFSDILWPDFGVEDLSKAIAEFEKRDRRYGARTVNEGVEA